MTTSIMQIQASPHSRNRVSFAAAARHAFATLRRGLRAGDLRVLALALVIAASVASGVGLFTDRVLSAIDRSAGDALGADAVIRSSTPLPAELLQKLHADNVRIVAAAEFPSVVTKVAAPDKNVPGGQDNADDVTQLSSIKAVETGYPLRGDLLISDEPFAPAHVASAVPPRGQIWVDAKLWTMFGLGNGAQLQVGSIALTATAVIVDEPGRGNTFANLAPELMMNAADLDASGLIGPGSRVQYVELLGASSGQIAALNKLELPRGMRLVTPKDARPELKQSLTRARQFLDIAVLMTLLLAAAAVALSARQYGARLRDEVALLKTLGAGRRFLLQSLLMQMLLLGLIAGGTGVVLGALAQELLGRVVAPVLGVALPWPSPWPLLLSLGVVLLMLAGFALPPVIAALATPPVRVLQRAATASNSARASAFAALAAVGALLWLQAGDIKLAAFIAIGAAATATILALLAWALIRLLRPLRTRTGVAWRFGLGNLVRRGPDTVAQTVALGVALLSLLLVTVVRQDLLGTWRNRLPADTPNQFLINIQREQREPLQAFFIAQGYPRLPLLPMVRAHLTAINHQPVTEAAFEDPETRRWINREFNLSWTDHFGADNQLIAGEFWTAADAGKPWLSIEQDAAKRLKLKLGDTLDFDIAGQNYSLTVHDLRKVHWDSFKPNFFMMTPPGVLDAPASADRAEAPVQWVTSFYLPKPAPEDTVSAEKNRKLLRELVRQFPNVTALDLDAALAQVRSIVDRVVRALELVLLFTLLAGLVVMLAVIEGSRAERVRETGVLRALGASSRVVLQGLLAEYAVLGLLAGSVAAIAAQAIAWVLAVQVFDLPYGPRPVLLIAGALSGCLIVTLTGWLSLRRVLNSPPRAVLAAG